VLPNDNGIGKKSMRQSQREIKLAIILLDAEIA
jgi:hypothetical protein